MRYASVVGVTAAVLLSGCAATPPTTPPTTPSASVEPTAGGGTAASLPKGVTAATNVPTAVPNDPGVRKNVTLTKCAEAKGGWLAKGTAVNKEKTAKTYQVTVFFTSGAATVLHTDSTEVTVKPGKKADWTVKARFTAPKGTLCVLRGVA